MLQILTGDIQIGKTRWLQRRVEAMSKQGLTCYGVVSPGIWREYQASDGSLEYEKLGIEALLLPQGKRLPFARRRDLADAERAAAGKAGKASKAQGLESQSAKAGLGWAIADESIAAVNAHFDWIGAEAAYAAEPAASAAHSAAAEPAEAAYAAEPAEVTIPALAPAAIPTPAPAAKQLATAANATDDQQQGLLVIDELGRLELMHDCGFSSAIRLLESGPTRLYADALVVARDSLASLVQQRFAKYWGDVQWLSPVVSHELPGADKSAGKV